MGMSLSTAAFRFKPLIIITVLVLALTSYAVASTIRSTYEHPTYTIHKVFQTRSEYEAFRAQLYAMPGVGERSTSVRYGQQVEADFKVYAPPASPRAPPIIVRTRWSFSRFFCAFSCWERCGASPYRERPRKRDNRQANPK